MNRLLKESIFLAVVVFFLSNVVSAYAEPERYDFPVIAPKENPVKLIFPTMPKIEEITDISNTQDVQKVNEAKRESIATLLRKYNKKLTAEKAYDYAVYIIQASDRFKQNPFVIAAMVVNESSARSDAISRGGDYGLMQVRWRVHQKKIRKKYPHIEEAKDILNPKDNLLVGTEIFSTYRATAKQDVRGALMYYSAGNERLADKVLAVVAQLEKSYTERLKNS